MADNIKTVVENALCTACGACEAICPSGAIKMKNNVAGFIFAAIDEQKCINCRKCYHICPSVKGNLNYEGNVFHGECIQSYIGYATNKEIRKKSQSGGIVTSLLLYLLENNLVDSTIVNCFDKETKRPKVVVANNKQTILDGCGSYYTQTSVAKVALEQAKGERVAAVMLGCQAESIRNIEIKYPDIKTPKYIIGLFCAGQNSGYMIDELIKKSDVAAQDVERFRFRDKQAGKWPGNVNVIVNGKSHIVNKSERHNIKPVYECFRCILCFNQMNVFSDIAVGDPWGIPHDNIKDGISVLITRTEKGEKLLRDANEAGYIKIEKISKTDILNGQTINTRHKTKFFVSSEYCMKNGFEYPYDMSAFTDETYIKATAKQQKQLFERLCHSRKLYLVNDEKLVHKITKDKVVLLARKKLIVSPFMFIKRCIRYMQRKLKTVI